MECFNNSIKYNGQIDRPSDVVFRIHYNGVFQHDPLRSLPLKSRPFKNDIKGRNLFTNMYYAEDEGFEMYPPLNEDEVGKEDLLVWCFDLENEYINDAAKILEAMSEGNNDVIKSIEFTQGV
nr:hypothetical protein [Tanacetum cinerariifolium]